ncbi:MULTISPECIES: hypothetical protein [Gordonia]|uniref:Acyl-CoA synthase n=3 Tax=Gordonia TaxID=2053 RepID=A0A3G8JLG9_9ACTN|nr:MULTISPECIES: hypothetical protein [Gordonia]ASR03109.1 hypothetical protein GCWB2_11560 [Gordonia rubripertincta]AZG45422.1 hypothetical protein D7316_02018 [Gordonia insulae]MDG6782124.1 acyl-CoA synthase [Gordonia rubripertincta]NKY64685.1 acyl-CoA synthase [Gordonia rubripertincta]
MSDSDSGPDAPQREEAEDHDLLTYGEAGVRVFAEVGKQKDLLAEMIAAGADEAAIVRARQRLSALEDAQERNRRQPINDENFESFFGYPGTARRNT